MQEYKVRNLNLLDIRRMAKILKEIQMSKEDLRNIAANIFTSAAKLSEDKKNKDNIGGFIKAAAPAFDGLICLLADSDSFWEFLASLLSVSYKELEGIELSEVKNIIISIAKNEQVAAFFTSITETEVAQMTAV